MLDVNKDFKAAIIKVFQQAIINMFETNFKKKNVSAKK